jgi:endoglucanase
MRRGISFGGALDGPGGRGWLAERHFDVVRDAGFDTVRLPVKWSSDAFEHVDWAIGAALDRDLDAVVDVHHFDDDEARLLALWERIAERYATVDHRLAFELLNEPHPPMTAGEWNALLARALAVVRATNPDRAVIVGPMLWNTVEGLPALELPADPRLIVTVHYYSPFPFTHQGATWLPEARDWASIRWGAEAERARVSADLEGAAAWCRERGLPLFLGEFGVVENADMDDRAAWTRVVRTEAERLGIPWAYWDFATDFGAYDLSRSAWRSPLRQALLED